MVDKINQYMNFAEQSLNVRHERQKVLSGNIANADTPGFHARDFDFGKVLESALSVTSTQGAELAKTNQGHLSGQNVADQLVADALQYRRPEQASMDANTVDMDVERAQFLDNSMRYQADMSFLNSKIKSMKAAMSE